MLNFLHRLFNPHCEHCREEREEARHCSSCEILKSELERANREKQQLLSMVLMKNEPQAQEPPSAELQPIRSAHIPWNVRKQAMEAESREAAAILRKKQAEMKLVDPSVEKLEKELGVNNVSS